MSSDDDSCGKECTELNRRFLVIFSWVVGGFFVNLFLLAVYPHSKLSKLVMEFIDSSRRGSDICPGCCCHIIQIYIVAIFMACPGPLPLASVLCWYLWRHLQCLCLFCWYLPRQAARRRTQLAVDRLGRYPGQESWQARGWLIMMRAGHQRSSVWSKGWQARLRKLDQYDEANIIKYAMRDFMTGQTPPEIELLEAGRLKMDFVRAVTAVIEIPEEGLFRYIITYL